MPDLIDGICSDDDDADVTIAGADQPVDDEMVQPGEIGDTITTCQMRLLSDAERDMVCIHSDPTERVACGTVLIEENSFTICTDCINLHTEYFCDASFSVSKTDYASLDRASTIRGDAAPTAGDASPTATDASASTSAAAAAALRAATAAALQDESTCLSEEDLRNMESGEELEKSYLKEKEEAGKKAKLERSAHLKQIRRNVFIQSLEKHRKEGITFMKSGGGLVQYNCSEWLKVTQQGAFCTACQASSSFTSKGQLQWTKRPCLTQDKSAHTAIKKHIESPSHVAATVAKPASSVEMATPAKASFTAHIVLRCFACAWMVMHDLPTSLFPSTIDLCRTTGGFHNAAATGAGSFDSKNASWTSEYIAAEMRTAIAVALMYECQRRWEAAALCTFMADEVTDRANRSLLVMGLRFTDVGNGAVSRTDFMGIQCLPRGDAATVTAAIVYSFMQLQVALLKIIFTISDGAAVFAGQWTGVHQRLIDAGATNSAGIHCAPHKLPLWTVAAIKHFPWLFDVFFKTVEWCGRFFRFSYKRKSVFDEQQDFLGMDPRKLVESAFTRWLTHDASTACLKDSFVALLNTFVALFTGVLVPDTAVAEELPGFDLGTGGDVSAECLWKLMATYDFIYFLCMMRDILPLLAMTSRAMQGAAADFTILTVLMPQICDKIELMIENPGENQLDCDRLVNAAVDAGHRKAGKPSKPSRSKAYMEKNRRLVLNVLANKLRENMTAMEQLCALQQLLQFSLYPESIRTSSTLSTEVADGYFQKYLKVLADKYDGRLWEDGELTDEWNNWRAAVVQKLQVHSKAYIATENEHRQSAMAIKNRRARLADPTAVDGIAERCTFMPFKVCCSTLLQQGIAKQSKVVGLLCEMGLVAACSAVECERFASMVKRKMRDQQHNRSVKVVTEEIHISHNGPAWTDKDAWMVISWRAAVIFINMRHRKVDLGKTNLGTVDDAIFPSDFCVESLRGTLVFPERPLNWAPNNPLFKPFRTAPEMMARMAKLKEEALANQEKLRVASELDRANTLELALEGGTRDLGVHTRTWFGICCRGGHRGMLVGQHR